MGNTIGILIGIGGVKYAKGKLIRKYKRVKVLNDPEVQKTLERIEKNNGKYKQDGQVFNNNEGLLPKKEKGYYTEWTVDTPGLNYRGPRRIVKGKKGELYYTDNHYKSFIRIK